MKNIDLAYTLKTQYSNQSVITTQEIREVLIELLPEVSDSTLSWRINQLKAEKLIHQVGRGLYSFEFKPEYIPELSLKTKRLYNRIKGLCPTELCVWDTPMLNTIGDTNVSKHWIFIATSKDQLELLFDEMLDFSKQVFLQPDEEIIRRYILSLEDAIILVPLASEMPIYKDSDYTSPTIEGILVDAWIRSEQLLAPGGFDINRIFHKAFEKYNINQSKLLRYATRRDKRTEIANLIDFK